MMQSHKHQEPSFQSLRSAVSSGSPQQSSDLAVHAFHHICGRGQIQCWIQQVRTVLIQTPQEFTEPIPIGLRTQWVSEVSPYTRRQSFGDQRVSCCDDFPHRLIRSSPSAPPFDSSLDATQEYMEAGHEVKVASLQDPAVICRNMLDASNTIGNQRYNATPTVFGYAADAPAPSLRRFPFLTQDGTQENGTFSVHTPHGHQIRRPSRALEAKPQRIDNQEQRTGRDMRQPWFAIQHRERCGIALAHSGNCSMSAVCLARHGLLASHRMSNTCQSPLSRLSPPPLLPDRPGCLTFDTTSSMFAVPMNNRVQAPNFSVSCFHTQRIQDKNKETSMIFLA